MGGFAHALGHVLKTGFDMTETGQRYNQGRRQDEEEQQRLQDQELASVLHTQSIGGNLIHNGLVREDHQLPDGTTSTVYRPPNPDRYISKVKVGKDTLQFEVPNDAEQHAYQSGVKLADLHRQLSDPTATADRTQQQEEAARGAGMTSEASAAGTGRAQQASRQARLATEGVPVPPSLDEIFPGISTMPGSALPAAAPLTDAATPSGSSPDTLPVMGSTARNPVLPNKPRMLLSDELDKDINTAGTAENVRSQVDQRLTTKAVQELSSANDQQSYDAVRKSNPKATANWPAIFHPAIKASLLRQNVPVEKQPEYDIQELTRQAMDSMQHDPAQVDAGIDEVVPPTGATANLNTRTKGLVRSAMARGDLKGAQAIIKDASDQIGKTESAVATAKATAPIKINVNSAEAGARAQAQTAAAGLTDDDFRRAGEQYAISGVMPPMGMGSVGRGKIVHAAEQFARDSGMTPRDLATAQAAFKGDSNSLQKFQQQRDQIVSFEQTAQKNLDLFLDLANKIPDTGVPWLNTPIRNLDANVVGSANMAAVNAARQVANNEIAKVTSGGGLGGVLSDSARHEVASYNPASATFAQTKAVANVLKQDMANRHASMDATLGEIRGRIGNPGAANNPPQSSGPVTVTDPQGGVHTFPDQGKADAFKAAAGIR